MKEIPLSKRLWIENNDLVQEAIRHPFINGVRHGTLPREKFQLYLAQANALRAD
jgi:thiaminase